MAPQGIKVVQNLGDEDPRVAKMYRGARGCRARPTT